MAMKISVILWTVLMLHCVSVLKAGPVGMVEDDLTENEINNLEPADEEYINFKLPKEMRDKFYQGDIILTPEQKEAIEEMENEQKRSGEGGIEKRAVVRFSRSLWPNAVVPYQIDSSLGSRARIAINAAIDEYERKTCINFVPRTTQRDYIHFRRLDGCYTFVGRTGGRQTISIGSGCEYVGIVIHEIFHALGRWHEQSRPDRDSYIRVNFENIADGLESQFQKLSYSVASTNNIGYDHRSVMHYSAYAFSRNGRPTIEPLTPGVGLRDLGQRRTLTQEDLQHALNLYCGGQPVQACPVLTHPVNGRVSAPSRSVGGRATYSCNSGFTLSGSSTRTCQSGGTWSGTAPTCEPVQLCLGLSHPVNGRVSTPSRSVGGRATYSCNSGYTLSGSSTRTCQSGGTWSGTAPICNSISTQIFFRLGGRVYQSGSSCLISDIGEGDEAALLCVTENTDCCASRLIGEFYYPNRSLVRVRASGDSFYRNRGTGYIRLNRRNSATTPLGRYRCEIPDSNGVMQSIYINIVEDLPAICPALSNPDNGVVSAPTRTVGSVATYSCSSGYTLNGGATRICQSSGEWSGSQPFCQSPPTTTPHPSTPPPTTVPMTTPITSLPTTVSMTTQTTSSTNEPTTVSTTVSTNRPIPTTSAPPTSSRTGHIQSPNWPETYPVNVDLQWIIECPTPTSRISISLNNQPFWIGGQQSQGCSKDWVKIHAEGTERGSQFGPYCSNTPPPDFEVISDKALVLFHAGPKHHPSRTGFRLTYQCRA